MLDFNPAGCVGGNPCLNGGRCFAGIFEEVCECEFTTHPVDQQVMVEYYTSLQSRGALGWNTTASMCGQSGLICVDGKIISMWAFISFLLFEILPKITCCPGIT